MAIMEEENFPRGGKIIRKRHVKEVANLFSTAKPPKKKRAKKNNKKEKKKSRENLEVSINASSSLTYKKLQAGMIILGCVRSIKNLVLEVELPGLCFALIQITDISDPFIKHLNKLLETNDSEANSILNKLFIVGQYLPVKILNHEKREKGFHVEATINPRDINLEYNHTSFKKGMLIWCSINSKTDHGYEINTGVKNCRAFLPSKNIDEDSEIVIGKPMWCVIHKNEVTGTVSTLRLGSKQEHLQNTNTEIDNLNNVIPGTKVEFLIEKVLSSGVQGKFSEIFNGFVSNIYFGKNKLSDFHEGQLLNAYVLYTEPITKITHLSFNGLMPEEKLNLNIGDVVKGEVCGKSFNGVFFLFKKKYKGFATNRRLIKTIAKNKNIGDAINHKYPIGSKHQCRILDYNHLLKAYICTPEQSIVKEKHFYVNDLTLGQELTVTIIEIKEEGVVVSCGLIRGFITNLHISDVEYTNNIKKKFKVDQKVKARVLNIDENNKVLFTIKPSLVKCEDPLTKFEQAEVGKSYTGIVVKLNDKGALIAFYGNVKGWLNRRHKEKEETETKTWKYFFVGQVVTVFIRKTEETKLFLSLYISQNRLSRKIGSIFYGRVESIVEEGINFKMEHNQKSGFIPNTHLSRSLSLCKGIKETFKVGDKISNLMYMGGTNPQIYSRKESIFFENNAVPQFEAVKNGDMIRCLYYSTSSEGIYVMPLLIGFGDNILVSNENKEKILDHIEFKPYQVLVAQILNVDVEKRELQLSIKSENILNKKIEMVMHQFSYFLNEFEYLKRIGKKHNWDICQYIPGEEVVCQVEKLGTHGGCTVTLPNGAKGKVVPSLCPKTIKENNSVKGLVISHDFDGRYVDICLRQDIIPKINKTQDGIMESPVTSSIAQKLLVKIDYIVALLKHPQTNRQLVYIPTQFHDNDFAGSSSYYSDKTFKVCICGKVKNNLMGINKRLFIKMDKKNVKEKSRTIVKDAALMVKNKKQSKPKHIENTVQSENQKVNDNGDSVKMESDEEQGDDTANASLVDGEDADIKDEDEDGEEENTKKESTIVLPGMSSFFNRLKNEAIQDSSSDDEDNEPVERKKKKKMTPTERAEQLRLQEEKLSQIEKELADSSKSPESAEQFDRLLLAKPNSSELWMKYISFHIAATELDKARTVAKKALNTINMTFTEEKFNIWIVLLNLENTFGTKESFDKVLEDALKFNDPLKIYLRVIQIFADERKHEEMDEKVKKIMSKYKQEPTMWFELGRIFYQTGKFQEARKCKDSALRSIMDKKTQMNIIVRFAVLEFKFGEEDQACAIFESILTTDPRKVNIWITYVDQLVKIGQIEQARQVLERSILQKLPLRSMKSLFMKFRKFEEEHGNPETLESVKDRVQEYINKFEK